MKKISIMAMVMTCLVFGWVASASAHFGALIPSEDIISQEDSKTITLEVKFIHPMESDYMEMEKPEKFGVRVGGKNQRYEIAGKIAKDKPSIDAYTGFFKRSLEGRNRTSRENLGKRSYNEKR